MDKGMEIIAVVVLYALGSIGIYDALHQESWNPFGSAVISIFWPVFVLVTPIAVGCYSVWERACR